MKKTKYIPMEKQSKKAQREYYLSNRSTNGFNTGTRVHQDERHVTRAKAKSEFRRQIADY